MKFLIKISVKKNLINDANGFANKISMSNHHSFKNKNKTTTLSSFYLRFLIL